MQSGGAVLWILIVCGGTPRTSDPHVETGVQPTPCVTQGHGRGSERNNDPALTGGVGACCKADGSCSVGTQTECEGLDGQYQGDGSTCDDCHGACLADVLELSTCLAGSGVLAWLVPGRPVIPRFPAAPAVPPGCPPPGPAGCHNTTKYCCDAARRTFVATSTCEGTTGACCLANGCVDDTSGGPCRMAGGEFTKVGTKCTDDPCTGACCIFSGICANRALPCECTDLAAGFYRGKGTACGEPGADDDAIACTVPTGACCVSLPVFGKPCLADTTKFDCAGFKGSYKGDGSSCDAVSCPPTGLCPGDGQCCAPHRSAGCADQACCEAVCGVDPHCCFATGWDEVCVHHARRLCAPGTGYCGSCPREGDCCAAHESSGCSDEPCCTTVCALDPYCCAVVWDAVCATEAQVLCNTTCCLFGDADCNGKVDLLDYSAFQRVFTGP